MESWIRQVFFIHEIWNRFEISAKFSELWYFLTFTLYYFDLNILNCKDKIRLEVTLCKQWLDILELLVVVLIKILQNSSAFQGLLRSFLVFLRIILLVKLYKLMICILRKKWFVKQVIEKRQRIDCWILIGSLEISNLLRFTWKLKLKHSNLKYLHWNCNLKFNSS